MSIESLKNITGPILDNCHKCLPGEIGASVEVNDEIGMADVWFYQSKLYKFAISERGELSSLISDYRNTYGSETSHETWSNGISAYVWEDKDTVIQIRHGTNNTNAFALFIMDRNSIETIKYERESKG